MMVFFGHIGAGLIIAGLLNLNPILTIIGAVLPDLDALLYLTGKHWYKFHRKLTHSLLFLGTAILLSLFLPLMTPLTWGVVSHMIIDIIWYPGVLLFYPISKKKYYLMKSKYSKGVKEDTPIIAIKNWFHDKKQIVLESIVVIIGLIVYFLI